MDLFSRFNLGRRSTPLEADLRRITETDNIDAPPKDVLISVSQSSHDPDDRALIMMHLQECLSETSGRRWRRVHGGLVLLDQLLKAGAPALIQEISEGLHFDPVQRLTFLEKFEYGDDRRVQNIVRQKASALRGQLVAAMTGAEDGGSPSNARRSGAAASGGNSRGSTDGATSPSGGYNVNAKSFSSDGPSPFPNGSDQGSRKPVLVNGLASSGHNDDTTDEESDGASASRRKKDKAPARGGGGNGLVDARRRDVLEESTDSEEDSRRHRRAQKQRSQAAAPARKQAPAPQMDLLDMQPDRPAAAAPQAPAASQNLLDM